ncbi:MAG: class I SAM-dependent methyltransferase [Alphaproteobacteria bacterium]
MISVAEQRAFVTDHLHELGRWLGMPELAGHLPWLENECGLKQVIETAVAPVDFFRTKQWDSLLRLGLYRLTQYSIARALGTKWAIETGVLHGLSSIFVLQALIDNGATGRLISIDAPSTHDDGPANDDGFTETLPPGMGPGWVVPEQHRACWDLRIGRSTDLLTGILGDLGPLDLFIHDSEHTAQTMMFEFETAWPALRDGAILLADNIDTNTAFFDFARQVSRQPHILPVDPDHYVPGGSAIRFGILRK